MSLLYPTLVSSLVLRENWEPLFACGTETPAAQAVAASFQSQEKGSGARLWRSSQWKLCLQATLLSSYWVGVGRGVLMWLGAFIRELACVSGHTHIWTSVQKNMVSVFGVAVFKSRPGVRDRHFRVAEI